MDRVFVIENRVFPDPDPKLTIDEVQRHLMNFYPQLYGADVKQVKHGEYIFTPKSTYAAAMTDNDWEEPETAPELPNIAWRGLFADYRELASPTTEACDEFHFATFLQTIGCTLGHRLHVSLGDDSLYPNFYIVLVGKSALSRKDTAMNKGARLLNALHEQMYEQNPQFAIVQGLRSVEGLLDELAGIRKVRLIQLSEMLSLISKAHQGKSDTMTPMLTELYNCPPRLNLPVHQLDKPDCRESFVSILAGITNAWLPKAITEADILGGFFNRWMYFSGISKDPIPIPPKMDPRKRSQLQNNLNDIRRWADNHDGEVALSPEATALFNDYYPAYYQRCDREGLLPTLLVRVQDFIFKIALVYAAIDQSSVIEEEHLRAAIAVGNYLEASVEEIFHTFAKTKLMLQEQKVLDFLRSQSGPVAKRDTYYALNMAAGELDKVVQPLIKSDLVREIFIPGKSRRKRPALEAI